MSNMRTIRVTGKGQIKVKPDTTRITMSLEGVFIRSIVRRCVTLLWIRSN